MTLQQVTIHFKNPETSAEVTAEKVTEHFALAPVVWRDDEGKIAGLTGELNLVHIPTGATLLPHGIINGLTDKEYRELARTAQSLPLDWSIAVPENGAVYDPDGLFPKALREFLGSRSSSGATVYV